MNDFMSIFNDVIGPVMRGPSSSHTAGSYNIGRMIRSLLDEPPRSVLITFHPEGSYGKVFKEQGVDLAFATGLMGWALTDERFSHALEHAVRSGLFLEFHIKAYPGADHPNSVQISAEGERGKAIHFLAKSTGGGGIVLTGLDDWIVELDGKSCSVLVESRENSQEESIRQCLPQGYKLNETRHQNNKSLFLYSFSGLTEIGHKHLSCLDSIPGIRRIWRAPPLFHIKKGNPLFSNAEEMVSKAEEKNSTLGDICQEYESQILGLDHEKALQEMTERYRIMKASIHWGLQDNNVRMQLLEPSASALNKADKRGELVIGGIHSKAAVHALAVMHACNSRGVICAAPTGGSAGVIPGVLSAFQEVKRMSTSEIVSALFAAGGVGLIIARRATFAAEIAGCQVEIGAAGAMAAAAVVELAGGTARQASDAAAVSLQNTMGSVCDLVQGLCEIPCHTRNAAAASNAIICAELVLGGYKNLIPLDETIDAMIEVGKAMPCELRVTSLGGLAATPSARTIKKKN